MAGLKWLLFRNGNRLNLDEDERKITFFGFDSEGIKYVMDRAVDTKDEDMSDYVIRMWKTSKFVEETREWSTIHRHRLVLMFDIFTSWFIFHNYTEDLELDSAILFEAFLPLKHAGTKIKFTDFPDNIKEDLTNCGTIEDKKLNQILTNYFLNQY